MSHAIIFSDHLQTSNKDICSIPESAKAYIDAFKHGAFKTVPILEQEGQPYDKGANDVNHANQIAVDLIWFDEEPLYAGRPYRILNQGEFYPINITEIKYAFADTGDEKISVKYLEAGGACACNIALDQEIAMFEGMVFPIYHRKEDRIIGAGVCKFPLFRSSNIKRQHMDINKAARSDKMQQKPVVLWFTGLSGSGKSTVANHVEQLLFERGHYCYTLDGDNVRHGLNKDLGFTDADRVENIRRIGEVSKLMVDAGLITLVSFISPFRSERAQARSIMQEGEFVEIFIDTPLEVCQERDVKGLYKKALAGEIKNFTGISSPYEAPLNAEITLKTTEGSPDEMAQQVISYLTEQGVIK